MILNPDRKGLGLSIAVIGAGAVAPYHVKPQLELGSTVMIYDKNQTQTDKLVNRYRSEFSGFISSISDPHEAIERSDLVMVLTPDHLHTSYAADALAKRKAVFAEKPFTTSLAEARKLADLSKEQKCLTFVGHWATRLHPIFADVKRIVESGRIGSLQNVDTSYEHNMRPVKEQNETYKRQNPVYGGGVHALDLGFWIANSRPLAPEILTAEGSQLEDHPEDSTYPEHYSFNVAYDSYRSRSSVTGRVGIDYFIPQKIHGISLVVTGTDGEIRAHNKFGGYLLAEENKPEFIFHPASESYLPADRFAQIMNNNIVRYPPLHDPIPNFSEVIPIMEALHAMDRMANPSRR